MAGAATAKPKPKPKPAAAKAKSAAGAAATQAATQADELSPELTELGVAFRKVFRTLSRLRGRDTHLGGSELSHAQFELLIELDERGELPAGELAAAARLTPATVTQMLDHLAAQGHVERVRSQTDRRVVVSRLTEQGAAKIEAKRSAWQSRWREALGDVPQRDVKAAARVLGWLGEMFEEASAEDACETPQRGVRTGSQAPQ
jgi:MarR family transcriptional regulator, organic hydroperoxide resistance regulator